jgi:hypothetical protein
MIQTLMFEETKLTLIIILFSTLSAFSQRVVTGRVVDKDSGKPVIDAVIKLINSDVETRTNALGFFQLSVDTMQQILVTSSAYETMQGSIPLDVNNFSIKLVRKEIATEEEIFTPIDESATFPGGFQKFYTYISKNMKYPKSARKAGITGKVFVEFVIDKDGVIDTSSVRVPSEEDLKRNTSGSYFKSIDNEECKLEAIRLIKNSPAWNPALQKGKPVKQRIVLPVTFE